MTTISTSQITSQKEAQRQKIEAEVEADLAAGGTITTADSGWQRISRGPDQSDFMRTPGAAAYLGFSEQAIKASYKSKTLGGHPAPDFIRRRATSEPMFMREAVYQWLEKYGKGGVRKQEKAA